MNIFSSKSYLRLQKAPDADTADRYSICSNNSEGQIQSHTDHCAVDEMICLKTKIS